MLKCNSNKQVLSFSFMYFEKKSAKMKQVVEILRLRPLWLIGSFRALLTLNIIVPGLTFPSHVYPLDVLLLTALAYWLDLGKFTLAGIFLLALATYFNVDHFLYPHYE